MHIPHDLLDADTLQALIEEFVTREGTDYGGPEVDLSGKVAQIRAQLARGEAVITFDADSGTCNIVPTAG